MERQSQNDEHVNGNGNSNSNAPDGQSRCSPNDTLRATAAPFFPGIIDPQGDEFSHGPREQNALYPDLAARAGDLRIEQPAANGDAQQEQDRQTRKVPDADARAETSPRPQSNLPTNPAGETTPHRNDSSDARIRTCNKCGQDFEGDDAWYGHFASGQCPDPKPTSTPYCPEAWSFRCAMCDDRFESARDLASHIVRLSHFILGPEFVSGPDRVPSPGAYRRNPWQLASTVPCICITCLLAFRTKAVALDHKRTCGHDKQFLTRNVVINHAREARAARRVQAVSTNSGGNSAAQTAPAGFSVPRFTCGVCAKSFVSEAALIRHKDAAGHNPPQAAPRAFQSGDRVNTLYPYVCPICHRRSGDVREYLAHLRRRGHHPPMLPPEPFPPFPPLPRIVGEDDYLARSQRDEGDAQAAVPRAMRHEHGTQRAARRTIRSDTLDRVNDWLNGLEP